MTVSTILLVGPLCAGKSTVARLLKEEFVVNRGRAAYVIDLDRVVHDLYCVPRVRDEIVAQFGKIVRSSTGQIDRTALATIVFGDLAQLRRLEELIHPLAIRTARAKRDSFLSSHTAGVVIIESPLPYDVGQQVTIFVQCEKYIRRQRARARGLSIDDSSARIAAQPQDSIYALGADYTIRSDQDLASVAEQVRKIVDVMVLD